MHILRWGSLGEPCKHSYTIIIGCLLPRIKPRNKMSPSASGKLDREDAVRRKADRKRGITKYEATIPAHRIIGPLEAFAELPVDLDSPFSRPA